MKKFKYKKGGAGCSSLYKKMYNTGGPGDPPGKKKKNTLVVASKDDPRYQAFSDSLNLYNQQNAYNAQFLSNFPSVPTPKATKYQHNYIPIKGKPPVDLVRAWSEIRKNVGNTQLNKKNRAEFSKNIKDAYKELSKPVWAGNVAGGPWLTGNKYQNGKLVGVSSYPEVLKSQEKMFKSSGLSIPTVLRAGDYVKNSDANWKFKESAEHYRDFTHKPAKGYYQDNTLAVTDSPYNYDSRVKSTSLRQQKKANTVSYGVPNMYLEHETIKPVGYLRYHASMPGILPVIPGVDDHVRKHKYKLTPRAVAYTHHASGPNAFDPNSIGSGYDDYFFYNKQLPYYAKPEREVIVKTPPKPVSTSLPKPTKPSKKVTKKKVTKKEEIKGDKIVNESKPIVAEKPITKEKPIPVIEKPKYPTKAPEGYSLVKGWTGGDGISYGDYYTYIAGPKDLDKYPDIPAGPPKKQSKSLLKYAKGGPGLKYNHGGPGPHNPPVEDMYSMSKKAKSKPKTSNDLPEYNTATSLGMPSKWAKSQKIFTEKDLPEYNKLSLKEQYIAPNESQRAINLATKKTAQEVADDAYRANKGTLTGELENLGTRLATVGSGVAKTGSDIFLRFPQTLMNFAGWNPTLMDKWATDIEQGHNRNPFTGNLYPSHLQKGLQPAVDNTLYGLSFLTGGELGLGTKAVRAGMSPTAKLSMDASKGWGGFSKGAGGRALDSRNPIIGKVDEVSQQGEMWPVEVLQQEVNKMKLKKSQGAKGLDPIIKDFEEGIIAQGGKIDSMDDIMAQAGVQDIKQQLKTEAKWDPMNPADFKGGTSDVIFPRYDQFHLIGGKKGMQTKAGDEAWSLFTQPSSSVPGLPKIHQNSFLGDQFRKLFKKGNRENTLNAQRLLSTDEIEKLSGFDKNKYLQDMAAREANIAKHGEWKPYLKSSERQTTEGERIWQSFFSDPKELRKFQEARTTRFDKKGNVIKKKIKPEIDWENWVKYKEDFHNNPEVIKELNEIEIKAKADGTWMKNPDGTPFKGTKEQFVIQQSENFKKFHEGSKVTGEKGEPLFMYHGSPNKDIKTFLRPGDEGYKKSPTTTTGKSGIYFSNVKEYADMYQNLEKPELAAGKTYQVYLSPKNAVTAGETSMAGYGEKGLPSSFLWNHGKIPGVDAVKAGKYHRKRFDDADYEVSMENPNLIKSAEGNILFNTKSSNIYKSLAPIIGAGALGAGYSATQKK